MIDSALNAVDLKEKKAAIEKIVTSNNWKILDTDDMGLVPLAYPLRGQNQGAIISYQCSIDPTNLDEMKSQLSLEKWLAKYYFYGMKEDEQFLKYADLQKKYEEMHAQEEEALEEEADQEQTEDDN